MSVWLVVAEAELAECVCKGLSENGFVVDAAKDGIDGRHLELHDEYDLALLVNDQIVMWPTCFCGPRILRVTNRDAHIAHHRECQAMRTARSSKEANMKIQAVILAAALGGFTPWLATAASEPVVAEQPAAASGSTEGELKKVDKDQSKITIKHGQIDNLGMPGMTMVFRADPAVLAKFKAGDMVRFKADRVDGSLTVTELLGR